MAEKSSLALSGGGGPPASAGGGGGVSARVQLGEDEPHHRIEIAEYVGGRDAQGRDALFGEPRVAPRIAFGAVAAVMRFAVDFDDEPALAQ